jgi:putative peptidoglycan lipid II flippase
MKIPKLSQVGLGALLLALSSVASRGLGILRDFVFAKVFGIGTEGGVFALDAYYMAFRIPDLIYSLLILGALSAAFIPLFVRLKTQGEARALEFANRVLSAVFFSLFFLGLIFYIVAPWLIPIFAPGFDAELLDLVVDLSRILLFSPLFMGLSGILQGIESVHKKFLGLALAPILYNVSIIFAAIFFAPRYGVYALAFGASFGAFLHLLIQIPGVLRTKFRFQILWPKLTQDLKEFFSLALPRVLGMSASQVTLLVDFALASTLGLGSLSIYSYALNLQSFPYGVLAVSFSVAVFATLSEKALLKDKKEFIELLRYSFHSIWFWAFPAVLGLFLLREPLIAVILKGGAFDTAAASRTEQTFSILIWGALAQSLIPLWSRAFYALSNTKTPVLLAVLTMALNVVLSLVFTQVLDWSTAGLAAANLIASSFNALLLLIFLSKTLKTSLLKLLSLKTFFYSVLAAFFMTLSILFFPELPMIPAFARLLLLSAIGALVYLLPFKFIVIQKS